MAVDEVALNEALDDLRSEVEVGCEDFSASLDEIAAEYSLNRGLLARKFEEKFGSTSEVVERWKTASAKMSDERVLRAIISIVCYRYRLKQDKFFPLEGRAKVFVASRWRRGKWVNLYLDYRARRVTAEDD